MNWSPDVFVQFGVVDHEANISVLLGNEETWSAPFRWFILRCDNLAVNKFLDDLFCLLSIVKRNLTSSADAKGCLFPGVRWIFIATHPVFMDSCGKSSVRTVGLSLIRLSPIFV